MAKQEELVFGIHAVGGIISDFNRCILCRKPWWSWVFGGDITSISGQVTVQCLGVGATLICSGLISTIILKVIDVTMGLRVSGEEEMQGLGLSLHDERSYIISAS